MLAELRRAARAEAEPEVEPEAEPEADEREAEPPYRNQQGLYTAL